MQVPSDLTLLDLRGPVRELEEWSETETPALVRRYSFDRAGALVGGPTRLIRTAPGVEIETLNEDGSWAPRWFASGGWFNAGAAEAVTSFSPRGLPAETKLLSRGGAVLSRIEYQYDAEDRLSGTVRYGGDIPLCPELARVPSPPTERERQLMGAFGEPNQLQVGETFLRDAMGRVAEEIRTIAGLPVSHIVRQFNGEGDVVRFQNRDEPPYEMEYEYDTRANWTRKVTRCLDWRGEERRRISYYD